MFSGGKASTTMADQENMAQDSAERAFFELQDAKVNFFQEKTEHADKMEKRKQNQTFTNGFFNGSSERNGTGQENTVTSTTNASSTH